ncbi:MAG TPA: carboxypeptidase-like regulatory domain-containing protein, partial [Sphingobacteriaceae bacterium]
QPDYLNLSIRKNLNMPLVGLRRYKDLKVVLFKDMNNNSVFDSGDLPISDAKLVISGQRFTTDSKGTVTYRNIGSGDYTLELKQDDNVRGWVAKNGFRQELNVDRSQTWYIPFKESRFISGRVHVVKDGFSKLSFSTAGIRISALNSKGESYSTLTNGEGRFFLNLPADSYLLQINKNVFNEEFRVLQDSFRIDLTGETGGEIVFEVREKKRAINIRKAG